MPHTPTFDVTLLPHSHPDPSTWKTLIQHQKTLRLQALQISPDAFCSTYAREVAFSDKEWEKRLQNPLAHTIVAYFSPPPSESCQPHHDKYDLLAQGHWVGSAVLLGPVHLYPGDVQREVSGDSFDNGQGSRKAVEFVIAAVWVSPAVQRQGLGRRLMEASVAHALSIAKEEKQVEEVVLKIATAISNETALKAYEAWGFVRTRTFPGERAELVELVRRVRIE